MSEVATGRIGELIAALRLTQMGIENTINPLNGSDIIATTKGKLYRVQVKARSVPDSSRPTHFMWTTSYSSKKKVPYTRKHCDIIALVSIPHENVYFMPVIHQTSVTRRLKVEIFDDKSIASSTWEKAISELDNSDGSS
jgi:uncharacterized protein YpbB